MRITVRPCAAAAAAAGPVSASAAEQSYPSRPIRMVVPFPPGAASDFLARVLGQKLGDHWGQQIVVDNRPGAGGSSAARWSPGRVPTATRSRSSDSPISPRRSFRAARRGTRSRTSRISAVRLHAERGRSRSRGCRSTPLRSSSRRSRGSPGTSTSDPPASAAPLTSAPRCSTRPRGSRPCTCPSSCSATR